VKSGNGRRYVLDANALIGFFEDREGAADRVERLLGGAAARDLPVLMSAVNWGEVVYVAWRLHGEGAAREVAERVRELPMAIIPADQERATRAAALKQKHGLGYADSFAAELAMERGAWLVTADPEFEKLGKALSVLSLAGHRK
jgi:predicted nucleic acid-binding protein